MYCVYMLHKKREDSQLGKLRIKNEEESYPQLSTIKSGKNIKKTSYTPSYPRYPHFCG